MKKKLGIVAAAAAAGLLAATPLAFADDGDGAHIQFGGRNIQDSSYQHPVQLCNNSAYEGVAGYLVKDQENSDSHDGDCKQKNSAEDSSGSN